MKMQIAFRESRETSHGRSVFMATGLVSAPRNMLLVEAITEFALDVTRGALSALSPMSFHPVDERYPDELASIPVGSMVTQQMWPLPVAGNVALLYLRKTRATAHVPGYEVLAFAGLVVVRPDVSIDCDRLHTFAGVPVLKPDDPVSWDVPPMIEGTRGNALTQFLRLPLWGFGTEPVSLPSTMLLEINDAVDRYAGLVHANNLSDDEAAERDTLKARLRAVGLTGQYDDQSFVAAMRILRERHPDLGLNDSSSPRTRSDAEMLDRAMMDAVRQMLEEQEGPSMAMSR